MLLPEMYVLAREVYHMIASLPFGQKISRNEINLRLRASSNDQKIRKITTAIRSMLVLGQIQKQLHRDSCQVVFWATQNSQERGEAIRPLSPEEEQVVNYLEDPPPPAPPPAPEPPPETEPEPPKVVPPKPPKTLRQLIEEFFFRRETCTLRVLKSQFPTHKTEVLDIVKSMWEAGELCIDSTSSKTNWFLWLPTSKTNYINDTLPGEAESEGSGEDGEFYMMRDLKNKSARILLRPTGDTLSLTVEEIEFIKGLKKPYVTL